MKFILCVWLLLVCHARRVRELGNAWASKNSDISAFGNSSITHKFSTGGSLLLATAVVPLQNAHVLRGTGAVMAERGTQTQVLPGGGWKNLLPKIEFPSLGGAGKQTPTRDGNRQFERAAATERTGTQTRDRNMNQGGFGRWGRPTEEKEQEKKGGGFQMPGFGWGGSAERKGIETRDENRNQGAFGRRSITEEKEKEKKGGGWQMPGFGWGGSAERKEPQTRDVNRDDVGWGRRNEQRFGGAAATERAGTRTRDENRNQGAFGRLGRPTEEEREKKGGGFQIPGFGWGGSAEKRDSQTRDETRNQGAFGRRDRAGIEDATRGTQTQILPDEAASRRNQDVGGSRGRDEMFERPMQEEAMPGRRRFSDDRNEDASGRYAREEVASQRGSSSGRFDRRGQDASWRDSGRDLGSWNRPAEGDTRQRSLSRFNKDIDSNQAIGDPIHSIEGRNSKYERSDIVNSNGRDRRDRDAMSQRQRRGGRYMNEDIQRNDMRTQGTREYISDSYRESNSRDSNSNRWGNRWGNRQDIDGNQAIREERLRGEQRRFDRDRRFESRRRQYDRDAGEDFDYERPVGQRRDDLYDGERRSDSSRQRQGSRNYHENGLHDERRTRSSRGDRSDRQRGYDLVSNGWDNDDNQFSFADLPKRLIRSAASQLLRLDDRYNSDLPSYSVDFEDSDGNGPLGVDKDRLRDDLRFRGPGGSLSDSRSYDEQRRRRWLRENFESTGNDQTFDDFNGGDRRFHGSKENRVDAMSYHERLPRRQAQRTIGYEPKLYSAGSNSFVRSDAMSYYKNLPKSYFRRTQGPRPPLILRSAGFADTTSDEGQLQISSGSRKPSDHYLASGGSDKHHLLDETDYDGDHFGDTAVDSMRYNVAGLGQSTERLW